jgi:hypothetical protein
MPEMLTDNLTGVLFNPSSTFDLAEKVKLLVSDQTKLEIMRKAI